MHEDPVTAQLTVAAVAVWIIQRLKKASWFPWINDQTEKLNRVVAVLVAGVAAIGIHVNFESETGVLTITGLTLSGILMGAWEWLRSFVWQQIAFKATVPKQT